MPFAGDPLAFVGKRLLEEHHAALLKRLPPIKADPRTPNPFDVSDEVLRFLPRLKVGILGAGVGGLYTALMLDSLDIDYDILESSDRVGGRLSTHKFPHGKKYDYYEQGAMRFPLPKKDAQGNYKDGTMKRLGELIDYGPLNEGPDPLKGKLIPYYLNARPGSNPAFYYFNGILEKISDKPKGPFDAKGMGVQSDYAQTGADAINSDVTNPFIRMLVDDLTKGTTSGWEVVKANDKYSVRGYMSSKYIPSYNLNIPPQHLSSDVVNWCALLGGSSNGAGSEGYDRAITEVIFESLAFADVAGTNYGDVDWQCFEGGTETLSKAMEAYIKKKGGHIELKKRVTAVGQGYMVVSLPKRFPKDKLPPGVKESQSENVDIVLEDHHVGTEALLDIPSSGNPRIEIPCVTVTVNNTETRNYSHVISTLPLTVLRTVDLNDAGLNVLQKNALRALNYGPSVKIAVLFKSNWWTTKLGIVGGESFTDLPIRTIVYPSYGVDSSTPSTVLLASYTWTTDAYRLSALSSIAEREVLKELVLRNLAEAHGALNPIITYEYLKEEFVDINVKDWNHDPHTMGAFAFFGPGEFEALYTSLNIPAANNRLHFAGEALSTRHGWVVGALDSAWKAVYQYLKVTGQHAKIKKFKEIWGENIVWTSYSTLVEFGPDSGTPDILDQHLGLMNKAIQSGVMGTTRVV